MLLHDPLFLFATAVCLVVLVILIIGIGSFGKGGEFNRKYANKLMQARIAAQFLAVVAIVLFAWARSRTGAP
ncbi:twin transmembrane helix small protein [bacterium]|nr:twin transmembrane helix small protein [bacterium]